jgi:GntR family transcriptional regulator of arabinose operon
MKAAPETLQNYDEATRYHAVKDLLRRKVLSGEVGHGEQMTPEMELCRDINLSRTTVRKAIADLVDEGLLVRYRGRGTFVNFSRTSAQQRMLACLVCHSSVAGAYDLLIRGAEQAASEMGYQLLLANSKNDTGTAMEQVIRLNEARVAGSIVVPLQTLSSDKTTADVVRALKRADQKVVLVDEFSSDDSIPSVCSQNREAMYELTRQLIGRGYRRIAFLTSLRIESVAEREEGFRQAMAEHGLEVPPEYFLEVAGRDPSRQGVQEVDVFLAMRQPPEAIVCLHDLIALNVLRRCEERGWRVPEDVAVVGFDDLPQAAVCQPPLTTVHQPLMEMGRRAIELLVRQLKGEELSAHHERLPCRQVVRQSCGSKK